MCLPVSFIVEEKEERLVVVLIQMLNLVIGLIQTLELHAEKMVVKIKAIKVG